MDDRWEPANTALSKQMLVKVIGNDNSFFLKYGPQFIFQRIRAKEQNVWVVIVLKK